MTRHAYESAMSQQMLDSELVIEPDDKHDNWQHISQSIHHPQNHLRHHHQIHSQYAAHAALQEQIVRCEDTALRERQDVHAQATTEPESELMRSKEDSIADSQKWDEATSGFTHEVESAYNLASTGLHHGFKSVASGWDGITDFCTQVTGWLPGNNARTHAQELELNAQTEIKVGHYQLADNMLKRDLRFCISAFGLTDKLTVQISTELRALHQQHNDLQRLSLLNDE